MAYQVVEGKMGTKECKDDEVVNENGKQYVVRLMRRPVGNIVPGVDLVASKESIPRSAIQDGFVLLHRLFLSLDPAMRGWMRDMPSYVPPVKLGEIMRGMTVNEVVVSKNNNFRTGDIVIDESGTNGWSEYAKVKGSYCRHVGDLQGLNLPLSAHLGVLGMTGLTAYFGLIDVGKPKAGETVLVSGAAGATGSVVCQIAKNVFGCKVIGIAGSKTKIDWLQQVAHCDATINYKEANGKPAAFQELLRASLKQVKSKGVDIFFDNVGGFILNETLRRLNKFSRIVVCGAISSYNVEDPRNDVIAPTNYMALISTRSSMQGFIVFDYVHQYDMARKHLAQWVSESKIITQEDVRNGLEKAPEHLLALFEGGNNGKLVVKIADRTTKNQASL